jgi:nucleotide-binding universal stress UspA family protein
MNLKISILVTVSSEYFSEEAIRRAAYLAARFEGELTLLYIIEEKALRMIDRASEYALTAEERGWTEERVAEEIRGRAEGMLFERAALLAAEEGVRIDRWEIEQGEYAAEILNFCKRQRVDLIVMSFERTTLLDYRVLDWATSPIWVEKGDSEIRRILALPSNLSANERLLQVALEFARKLDAEFYMEYIVDPPRALSGRRALEELTREGQKFLARCQEEGLSCRLSQGRLERLATAYAREYRADLLIFGELLEGSRRSLKQRIMANSPCSVLFGK